MRRRPRRSHSSPKRLRARSATVAAIPTLFESISIPVYEAFSVGTAVCASNVVALPEQIGDAGLLFDPESADEIAAAISRLLGDPALRRTLVERGFQRMTAAIKFCPRPVVGAPYSFCLGGGAEIAIHAARRQVHAELYMGLVETGVGVVPAGSARRCCAGSPVPS